MLLLGALLLGSSPGAASAQAEPLRLVQPGDGSLHLLQGTQQWRLVPTPVSDDDLAILTIGGELDGVIPSSVADAPDNAAVLQVLQGSDGTLYLEQGNTAWTVVPDAIGDTELAALTSAGDLDGTLTRPSVAIVAPPPPPPPVQPKPVRAASGTGNSQACVLPQLAPASLNAPGVSTISVLDDPSIGQQVQRYGNRWAVIYSDYAVGASMLGITQAALQARGGPPPFPVPVPIGEANVMPYVTRIPTDGSIQVLLLAQRTTISSNDVARVLSMALRFDFNRRMAIIICAT